MLAIDNDWTDKTLDFYFDCALVDKFDTSKLIENPEIDRVQWFKISALPEDMFRQHRNFLINVLPNIPELPGVSRTSNQNPPSWWNRYKIAETVRRELIFSQSNADEALLRVVKQAREILNCELIGLFITEPPIAIESREIDLPNSINGVLQLRFQSSSFLGGETECNSPSLDVQVKQGEISGLTVWCLRSAPFGKAIRLHGTWLQQHKHVRKYEGHDHLKGRVCHSLMAVAIVFQDEILGLIKAENKYHSQSIEKFIPFGPDDGYILEEFAIAVAPIIVQM